MVWLTKFLHVREPYLYTLGQTVHEDVCASDFSSAHACCVHLGALIRQSYKQE